METKKSKNIRAVVALMTMITMLLSMLMPMEVSAASKKLGQVKNLKVLTKNYNSVKVSWKKVKGAKGYQVYRATSKNGKYKKVRTTKSISWTNSKLTTGKKYYYKVRAYKGSRKGKFSSKKSGAPKLGSTSIRAVAQSTSSIRVNWNKVSGSSGYQLYRADYSNGSYGLVKTTSSGSYTNSGLKDGRTYYYKVRAYKKIGNKKCYGSFSSKKSAMTSKKTQVTKLTLSSTQMTLKIGEAGALTASGSPNISWSTSDANVATYDTKYEEVTAIGAGSATITAKANGASASCKVIVKDTQGNNPGGTTDPTKPTDPTVKSYLRVIDAATGKEVNELQAGSTYEVESASTVYIGSDSETVGTSDSSNKSAQVCHYAHRELHPVAQGVFWLLNKEGLKKQYKVTKGTTITTAGIKVELGGIIPDGYTEQYETIYGYAQYVYNRDTANLVLVGAENGRVKTVFTMGNYTMNMDEAYLRTDRVSFGGTTIQPVRYYQYNMPEGKILSGEKLDNLGKEANLIASSIRVKNNLNPMKESIPLATATRSNVEKVYNYYGNSQKLDDNVHMISSLETYSKALEPLGYSINAENAAWGSYGSVSAAVSIVEALYDSPGHRAWMLNEKSQEVGSAFMYDGLNYVCALQSYAYKK